MNLRMRSEYNRSIHPIQSVSQLCKFRIKVFCNIICLLRNYQRLMQSISDPIFFLKQIKIILFINSRISGLFEFRRPVVLIKDPQIIKHLTIKDFDHFMDHRILITDDIDPLLGKNLVSLTGDKWKDMRSTLSPAFTGE